MAKTSAVEKNKRRRLMAKRYAAKRARLKAIACDQSLPIEERFAAQLKLAELMFVEVVRRWLAEASPGQTGWLAGLRDPVVGRALEFMHRHPECPWTLQRLAREVNQSRSVLAERFTHFVGTPPMQYLTRWRMQLAARMLADGSGKVAAIAAAVGYESEAAFNRAFARTTGMS